jgi:branched-chain amino acid transport system substrate-binding protein
MRRRLERDDSPGGERVDKKKEPSGLSRRDFLKAFGWAAGALAARPVLSGWESYAKTKGGAFKLGLLQPPSNVYPMLGKNVGTGIWLYLKQQGHRAAGLRVRLMKEEIGFGPNLARSKVRTLIEQDGVALVVGVLSTEVAARLRPIFEEARVPLLVSNAGADLVRDADRSPYLFYHSLGYWQASQAMGNWAAANLGKKAFVATSLYDGGYDSFLAFRLGFEAAGGEVLRTVGTHASSEGNGLEALYEEIRGTRPDFVCGFYSGQQAAEFVRGYKEAGLAGNVPLVGTAFAVDEGILETQGEAARGILSAFSWSRSLDNADRAGGGKAESEGGACDNQAFVEAFRELTGRPADAFAVLGYDTARLVLEAVNATEGDLGQLAQALRGIEFRGPRGLVRMDPRTQQARTPLYLREVRGRAGQLRNAVIGELAPLNELDGQIGSLQSNPKTGWLNAYMSV